MKIEDETETVKYETNSDTVLLITSTSYHRTVKLSNIKRESLQSQNEKKQASAQGFLGLPWFSPSSYLLD